MARTPQSWTKFYHGDWLSDRELHACLPAARGVYIDWLVSMFASGRTGIISGNLLHLSRVAWTDPETTLLTLSELAFNGAADVFVNGQLIKVGTNFNSVNSPPELCLLLAQTPQINSVIFSVVNRKMFREANRNGNKNLEHDRIKGKVAYRGVNSVNCCAQKPEKPEKARESERLTSPVLDLPKPPTLQQAASENAEEIPHLPVAPKPKKKPSGDHHELIRYFCGAWRGLYDVDFPFAAEASRNAGCVKKILLGCKSLTKAKDAVQRYLADEAKFVVEDRHGLPFLAGHLQKYIADAIEPNETGFVRAERTMEEIIDALPD